MYVGGRGVLLKLLFPHEVANFSRSSVSLCLTEHVGLVPPPIFRDVFYLLLFTCWPTSQNKTDFLKVFLLESCTVLAQDYSAFDPE